MFVLALISSNWYFVMTAILLLIDVHFAVVIASNQTSNKVKARYQVVYWSTKPYIYKEDNHTKGIFNDIFDLLNYYCFDHDPSQPIVEYVHEEDTMNDHLALMSNLSATYGVKGHLENVSNPIWFPYMHRTDKQFLQLFTQRNLTPRALFSVNELAIITLQENIELTYKLGLGLQYCGPIMLMIFIISLVFSIFIWLVERNSNEIFSKSFIYGTGKGLWLSVVTLVTVGYGDVAPKTIFGRILMSFWMIFGLICASIVTAIVTDTISSDSHLSLFDRRLAVINNSYEQFTMLETYTEDLLLANSYMEALKSVQSGDTFAAIINADIISWYQNFIRDLPGVKLTIVGTLPVNLPISFLWANENQDVDTCMKENWDDIITYTRGRYVKKLQTKTLIYPNLSTVFSNTQYILYGSILFSILFLGLLHDVLKRYCFKRALIVNK